MALKRRPQIPLNQPLYDRLRRRAFERPASMASMVREAVVASLKPADPQEYREPYPFSNIVGIGECEPLPSGPISENHDEALAEAYSAGWRSWDEPGAPADPVDDTCP